MHASKTLVYANLFNNIYGNTLIIPSKSFTPLTKGAAVVGYALLSPVLAMKSPLSLMSVAAMTQNSETDERKQ